MVNEKELKSEIEDELIRVSEVLQSHSKETYKAIHKPSVDYEINKSYKWIKDNYKKYNHFFANGSEINPWAIQPLLIEVKEQWHKNLFRLARYTWSLPYTKGYGRRLRFLIIDQNNNKLMGIFGLQSPPLDFPARDKLFNYPNDKKVFLINQTMDIYTLGALPPYNRLLAGKLVALAACSNEVRIAYKIKYENVPTQLYKRYLPPNLICLTTTSAFGRSSIYNRLKYKDELVAKSIGYTMGYGSFHLLPIYPKIREYLEERRISTKGGFGVGPRIVWQSFTRAQKSLNISKSILRHGLKREAYIFPLIRNIQDYMEGNTDTQEFFDRPFNMLESWWKERWLLKRAINNNGWHEWSSNEVEKILGIK